jgi:hypothetical protein
VTANDKLRVPRTVEKMADCVAGILGAANEEERDELRANFPGPAGLGTDGTCWTDEQHRAYFLAACQAVARLLARPTKGKVDA